MTTARAKQIDLNSTPYYHCTSRCVRRAYLYGKDPITGKDYSYRKAMVVNKIRYLASVFTIDICAYAVMSNHTHLVLHVNTSLSQRCSDEEIRRRWKRLCPNNYDTFTRLEAILSPEETAATIDEWRARLCSISEFMAHLNFYIARKCNLEDNCTGRFWEGRFKCQALLDEGALLSAMVYVDLNPIRSGSAKTPEESEFTSIYERLKTLKKQINPYSTADLSTIINATSQPKFLVKLGSHQNQTHSIDFKLSDYLQLVDITGRILREDKPGKIPNSLEPILTRLNLTFTGWVTLATKPNEHFSRAIGSYGKLTAFNSNKTHAIRGIQKSKQYYQEVA